MNFEKELGWTPLHCMVEKGEVDAVRELLTQGVNVNAKDSYNRTPLSIAASKNNVPLLELLIHEGASINDGFPLHYACEKGHIDVVTLLLKSGALVNLEREKNYPLLIAASKGNLEVTKMLIEHGDIHVVDEKKQSALHWACDSGNEDLISFLIDCGCLLDIKDRHDLTPLNICLIRHENKPNLVKVLLKKGASIHLTDDQGNTYLHDLEDPETILELIKYGVDVNAQNIYKETALCNTTTFRENNANGSKVLLQNNADPNIPARGGWTPLHFAAAEENLDYVEDLLKAGADVNCASAENIIPLHLAAKKGYLEIVRRLLEQESLVNVPVLNIRDINNILPHFMTRESIGDGATPFSLAADNKHVEVCKLLVCYGSHFDDTSTVFHGILPVEQTTKKINDWPDNKLLASVISNNLDEIRNTPESCLHITDSIGWTPLHHSIAKGLYDMSYEIIKKGFPVNALDKYQRTPLSVAAARNDLRLLTLLLDNGADVNLRLALHYAVDHDSFDCIKELIRRNCDINISDNSHAKSSVLLKAASKSKTEIVKILLSNNANPNCMNKWGETPLHESCRYGGFEVAQALVSYGANVNAVDTFKETPLMTACLHSHLDIIKLLLRNNAEVNVKDDSEWTPTPLHKAAWSNCTDAIPELLKAGALVNACSGSKETPLFLPAKNITILKTLIENGADVNYRTSEGWTPLHESAIEGNLECVKMLLQSGTSVNSANAEFILPIYLASIQGHPAIVKELLDNESYVDPYILETGVIRDDGGLHPLSEIYLIVPGNTPLIGAASKGHLEVVKILYTSGASLTAVNCRGNTALHEAVIGNFGTTVEFFLGLNMDLTIKNEDGKTAFDLAKERSNEELAQLFCGKN